MSSNLQLLLLLLILFLSCLIDEVNSTQLSLSKIRYHFTSCGSTGFDGPTFDQCEIYYQDSSSPIATDGVLFQFEEEGFRGGQGFRIPREDVFNVTIAGAAGGRGLCNIHFGRGRRFEFQIILTPDYELLVMVGQKGKSPCDSPSEYPLCDSPPTDIGNASQCNQTWYSSRNALTGGGGGGGASMLRARHVESRNLSNLPIVIAGGGGGTSAILDYATTVELIRSLTTEPSMIQLEQSYQYHIDARSFPSTDIRRGISSARGTRPSSQLAIVAGAGGGWISLLSSSDTDGKSISQNLNFAEGGLDCRHLLPNVQLFEEVSGGFGGGGGQCGSGGGGGGFTGGAVLDYADYIPGGGGHSFAESFSQDLSIFSQTLTSSFNNEDGYVDIVPANCNCTGYCAVNEIEDTFECFCPNDTQLAKDGFDCFNEVNINISKLEIVEINGLFIQGLQFVNNNSVELFSFKASLSTDAESVCAVVFLNRSRVPVAVSTPLRESRVVNMLAHLMVVGNYSRIVKSEYVNQFVSSVEVIEAALITNGNCFLDELSIEMNVSTRIPSSKGYSKDIGNSIADLAMISGHVLELLSVTTVTTQPQEVPNSAVDLVIGLVVAAVILTLMSIAVAVSVLIWCRFHKTNKKEKIDQELELSTLESRSRDDKMKGTTNSTIQARGSKDSINIVKLRGSLKEKIPTSLIIKSANLRLLDPIGQGEFGIVYKGYITHRYTDELVAVKSLKGFIDDGAVKELLRECNKMKNFHHQHVMTLKSVCLDGGPVPFLILPYMANGSLLSYIRKEQLNLMLKDTESYDGNVQFVKKRLLDMCLQIAEGMEYLAEKKLVHRDLAARNCMIDMNMIIKVADFGLAVNTGDKDYYRISSNDMDIKLPVMWMAPESLSTCIFSEKSDIWSYGVTCWEIFSGGQAPYAGTKPSSVLSLLQDGERLKIPKNSACSSVEYSLMMWCWEMESCNRPSFSVVVQRISQSLEEMADYLHVGAFTDLGTSP